ncbi:MAG TPA: hypothetical protein VKV04_15450 [Verrucomicrobiae bacterium]|nr:hypothetical protein [Verrucomicrobiae bacterium]
MKPRLQSLRNLFWRQRYAPPPQTMLRFEITNRNSSGRGWTVVLASDNNVGKPLNWTRRFMIAR